MEDTPSRNDKSPEQAREEAIAHWKKERQEQDEKFQAGGPDALDGGDDTIGDLLTEKIDNPKVRGILTMLIKLASLILGAVAELAWYRAQRGSSTKVEPFWHESDSPASEEVDKPNNDDQGAAPQRVLTPDLEEVWRPNNDKRSQEGMRYD